MPSLNLSKLVRRNPDRPSLRERATALKATAAKVMRRPLPALVPGSDAAKSAYRAASAEDARRSAPILGAYPELRRTSLSWWTQEDLSRALEVGELTPAECARLYPLASERELRLHAIEHRLNLGALHALAFADKYPVPAEDEDERDPAITAIEASRAAEAAMKAWQARFRGAVRPSEADFAEEDRLGDVQVQTRDAALSTTPTTRAGQLALVDYVRFQMEMHGLANGDPPDADDHIWRDTHKALSAALAAPIGAPVELEFDLSALDIAQLRSLHAHIEGIWQHVTAETQAPWCWDGTRRDYNVAGLFLDDEGERLSRLLDAISAEIRQRVPTGDRERDARLCTLVRSELLAEGRIADRAVFAELAAAWGALARG